MDYRPDSVSMNPILPLQPASAPIPSTPCLRAPRGKFSRPRRAPIAATLLAVFALLAACAPSPPATDSSLPPGWPTSLRLGYIHSEDLDGEYEDAHKTMAQVLQRELGLPVHLVPTAAYGPAIEALAERSIDLMRLSAYTYLLAHERAGTEAIVAYAPGDSEPYYHSVLITHPDSGLSTIDDIKAKTSSIRFLYNDPASLSGYLAPKSFFQSQDIDPQNDFALFGYSYSHYASLFSVAARRTDLAAVSQPRLETLIAEGKLRPSDVKVLWTSPPLPWGAISLRGDFPDDLKKRIQETLVNLHKTDPQSWAAVRKQHDEPTIRYHPTSDARFDELRSLRRQIESPPTPETE